MKKKVISIILLFFTFLFSGCGSKVVNVINKKDVLSHVCIENNPSVKVTDFVPVIEKVLDFLQNSKTRVPKLL